MHLVLKCVVACCAVAAGLAQPSGAADGANLTTLHVFGGSGDVSGPNEFQLIVKNNVLFGVTSGGGANGTGGIYRFDTGNNQEQVLYSFAAHYGKNGKLIGMRPGDLIYFQNKLFGETGVGGEKNKGLIFTIDPSTGAETDFVSFPKFPNSPSSRLVPIGNEFYGLGGYDKASTGAIYNVPQAGGKPTLDYAFSGFGNYPNSDLLDLDGLIYGTTYAAGDAGQGSIFKFDPSTNTLTVLHSFAGSEGSMQEGNLIYHKGALFGVNAGCGRSSCGTMYKFDLSTSALEVLHTFPSDSQTDGNSPSSPLAYANGKIYGVTTGGGTAGCGVVFSYDLAAGNEQVIYNFAGNGDGCRPMAGLIYDKGTFYGTTTTSQPDVGPGTIFSFTP